jgi:hypothetical protein
MVTLRPSRGVASGGARTIPGGTVGTVGYMNVMKYDAKLGWVGMKCAQDAYLPTSRLMA